MNTLAYPFQTPTWNESIRECNRRLTFTQAKEQKKFTATSLEVLWRVTSVSGLGFSGCGCPFRLEPVIVA
jgi:hypothetical protein